MPPRYAYWTIIIDSQPTAFRSAAVEELIPTFNRLKSKQPDAVLKWFQDGKLWDSRLDAREANIRKRRDERPKPRGRPSPPTGGKLEWQPKGSARPSTRPSVEKPRWQPKDDARSSGRSKLEWSPRGDKPRGDKPAAFAKAPRDKPGWSNDRSARPDQPSVAKPSADRRSYGGTRSGPSNDWRARGDKPSAFAKSSADKSGWSKERRSRGDKPPGASSDRPVQRDSKWRPGGEHRDPRQKYKDAKKAKWTRFKEAIRGRRPPRKP